VAERQWVHQVEYRWLPATDMSPIAGSLPVASIQPWNGRILQWVRHRAVDVPTESVRYEVFADGMAALAWRKRNAQAIELEGVPNGRPDAARILIGPDRLLTPDVAVAVCHAGLPRGVGPRPGQVTVGTALPPVDPAELTDLARDQADELDRLAERETGLNRIIAAALADRDTPLSVELPQRVIAKSPQAGSQGPLLWGLRRTVWPLLGIGTGRRGWSFSTYEPPMGEMDPRGLADIVFRTHHAAQRPPQVVRREIRVRPRDPVEPPASMYQDFARVLVAAYQYLGGTTLSRYLDAIGGDYQSVDKRIAAMHVTLVAALPAEAAKLAEQEQVAVSAAHSDAGPTTAVVPHEGEHIGSRSAQRARAENTAVIEVAIGQGGTPGKFSVEVVASPAGEASVAVNIDVDALLARREQLQWAVLASAIPSRRILPETERPVREIGRVLFTTLLGTGEVAGQYRAAAAIAAERGQRLRVVLRIDTPALAALPWEAMFDEATGTYVCRHDQLVRHVRVASVPMPLHVQPPLRILGVASSPRGLPALDIEKEQDHLARALAWPNGRGAIEVHWAPKATWADLHDLLLDGPWHAVHFIGHGDFDTDLDEGYLALVGDNGRAHHVAAHRLVDLLHQASPMPRLVVLNSCAGAAASVSDLFSGIASALVRGGVSAVAAMQYEISDPAAVAFARGFYTAIAHGRGIDDAVSSGRVAILGISDRTLEWITPVLYLRGHSTHLFAIT
jgi:CHAT domain